MKKRSPAKNKGQVGRPATGRNGKPVKLYIDPVVRKDAGKVAYKEGKSLSALVTELLREKLNLPVSG